MLVSDEWNGYEGLSKDYIHEVVDHGRGRYVNDCGFSSNSIENFWSGFKRGIIGVYHYVSRKHLQKYANEFSYRFNNRIKKGVSRFLFFLDYALTEKSITYSKLTCKTV